MNKAKHLKLRLKIYPYTIYCFMFDINDKESVRQHNKQYKEIFNCNHITKSNIKEYSKYEGHCISNSDIGNSVICIYNAEFNNKKLISVLRTIRHEVQHACNNVFKYINSQLDDNEPLLYLNDYVFKEIIKMI